MTQTEVNFYFLLRRKKRIPLTEIAEYIGCSKSLLSMFERGVSNMSEEKMKRYRQYITDNKNTTTIVLNI